MKQIDKKEFAMIIFQASVLYQTDFSDKRTSIYFDILKDFDIQQVKKAFDIHYRDPERGHRLPYPSDIIANIDTRYVYV